MKRLGQRIADLEAASVTGSGVVAVHLYDDETEEEAIAAHLAGGGVDPTGAEITVFLKAFMPRPVPAGGVR